MAGGWWFRGWLISKLCQCDGIFLSLLSLSFISILSTSSMNVEHSRWLCRFEDVVFLVERVNEAKWSVNWHFVNEEWGWIGVKIPLTSKSVLSEFRGFSQISVEDDSENEAIKYRSLSIALTHCRLDTATAQCIVPEITIISTDNLRTSTVSSHYLSFRWQIFTFGSNTRVMLLFARPQKCPNLNKSNGRKSDTDQFFSPVAFFCPRHFFKTLTTTHFVVICI